MKFRPLLNQVLIKRVAEEDKTVGGLFIPEAAKEKPARGVVISVGEGSRREDGSRNPPDVSVGDLVLFGKYAGTEIRLEDIDHMLVSEDQILAILD